MITKIVICGTHPSPAIALIGEVQKSKKLKIIFFGRKYATEGSKTVSAEFLEITNLGVPFVNVTSGRLQRKWRSSRSSAPVGSLVQTPVTPIGSWGLPWRARSAGKSYHVPGMICPPMSPE